MAEPVPLAPANAIAANAAAAATTAATTVATTVATAAPVPLNVSVASAVSVPLPAAPVKKTRVFKVAVGPTETKEEPK